jgi:hypothetical protein
MSILGQASMYARFALGLRKFLKEPMSPEQSDEIIRQRLAQREQNLLLIVKKAIYENKKSPYLRLLNLVGCEYGDFERDVRLDGPEETLRKLSEQGVYVTTEEFKGMTEVTRGSRSFRVEDTDFDNPFPSGHLEAASGASRSAGTRTVYDFEFLEADWAVYAVATIDGLGALDHPFGLWLPILPGGGPAALLAFTKGGKTPAKWFSPVASRDIKPSLKSRAGTSYIVHVGRMLGAKWPSPEYVAFEDAWKVAQWLSETIRQQGGCCVETYSSAATMICQAARERGYDIEGAKIITAGEPLTEAKNAEIEAAGARAYPLYGLMDGGSVGFGCFNPATTDDFHIVKDSVALIQYNREVHHAGVSVDAFLLTSLVPSAPKVIFNVETGDYGLIDTRNCGCKFERLGLTEHIHQVRGFDKLTAVGMTFVGTDMVRIIEQVLPSRFGGSSTDYQMLEEEDEKGHTRMTILVNPDVGPLDEKSLIDIVLAELSKGHDTRRMMAEVWSQADTLRVERARPVPTARGKLLPLHIQRRSSDSQRKRD